MYARVTASLHNHNSGHLLPIDHEVLLACMPDKPKLSLEIRDALDEFLLSTDRLIKQKFEK